MKKILALALTVVLAVCSFAACGENYENVLVVDGENIPAGVYLIAQIEAYGLAEQELGTSEDVLKAEFEEGVSGEEWVHAKTVLLCQRYVYIDRLFDEKGLVISEDEQLSMDASIENSWATYGEFYTANGVGAESYALYYTNNYKLQRLFEELYLNEGGEFEVSNEDAMAYMNAQYANARYMVLPLINSATYGLLGEEAQESVKAIAADMVAALAAGADEQDVAAQYLPLVYTIAGITELDMSNPSTFISNVFVNVDSTSYLKEFIEEFFAEPLGEWGVYQPTSSYLWVAMREANYATDAEFALYRESIVYAMTNDEFYDNAEAAAGEYEIQEVSGAVKYYSPKNITE